jgi:TrmH family RNA methyltransferase
MDTIASPANARIKQLVKLRERRAREASKRFLIDGLGEIELALRSGIHLDRLFVCPEASRFVERMPLRAEASARGVEVITLGLAAYQKAAYGENAEGWLALARTPTFPLSGLPLGPRPLVLVTEDVEKPGNIGALLRTADAAGAAGLIVCDPATDLVNANVIRASRGAVFTLPTAVAQTAAALRWLREHRLQIVAATPAASIAYTEVDLRTPTAIVVGAEDKGLSQAWLDAADLNVRIPMTGQLNSLNVSASAAVLLYEAVRQRQHGFMFQHSH